MNGVFCQHDRSILAQTKLSSAFLDGFPVSKGHALVISKRHVASIWEMTTEEYTDAFDLVRQVKDVLQKKFEPQGFNIGVNCGAAAGQLCLIGRAFKLTMKGAGRRASTICARSKPQSRWQLVQQGLGFF
jgi:hypothetical protein